MNKITLFTKDDCPLCDAAWFVIKKLRRRVDFEMQRIDVTDAANAKWYALYCNDIPVVHLNGKEVFRHRVSERRLREILEAVHR